MNPSTRSASFTIVLAASAALASAQTAAQPTGSASPGAIVSAQNATEPLRYVHAKDGGAKLYNINDKNGVVIESVPSKGVLAVWGEQTGYLNVTSPAGFPVWVYGQYLKPLPETGVVEVTGSNVLMRPLPSSEPSSYPLGQRLQTGDKLRVIARGDAKKPLAEDWVQVMAPETARGWIIAADAVPVPAGEDPKVAWKAAAKAEMDARPALALATVEKASPGSIAIANDTAAKPDAKKADKPAANDTTKAATPAKAASSASAELAAADKLYESAKQSSAPSYLAAKSGYQKVIDASPASSEAKTARARLEEIAAREEIVAIRNDAKMLESTKAERLEDAQRRLREASYSSDPMWGRFQARGWLERVDQSGAPSRWVIRWADKVAAEIVCTSGRYDLALFENYEVGVLGAVQRNAVAASAGADARPARIDASRLEVISGRATH